MRDLLRTFTLPLALAAPFVFSAPAKAVPVDLELSLVIDVSGSVSADEYNLQMDGYANAFRDSAIQNAILNGTNGAIATNVVFFSSSATEGVSFTLLNSQTAINAFADTLDNFVRPFSGGTTISAGINLRCRCSGTKRAVPQTVSKAPARSSMSRVTERAVLAPRKTPAIMRLLPA